MIVIDGPSGNGIGASVAKKLNAKYASVEYNLFPDGESHIKLPAISKGEDIAIVQTTYPMQDKRIMELLFMANELNNSEPKSISAIVPYLAYARQNKSFSDGDVASLDVVTELFEESGIDSLVVVEPHKYDALSNFSGRVSIVDVSEALAGAISAVDNPLILSPDKGGVSRASKIAGMLNCDFSYIEKERDSSTGAVSSKGSNIPDAHNKSVFIVDDIISTGGTICQAASLAREKGSDKITAMAVHLVMAGNAYDKLIASGINKVIGTNTIPFEKAETIDISGEIAKALSESLE